MSATLALNRVSDQMLMGQLLKHDKNQAAKSIITEQTGSHKRNLALSQTRYQDMISSNEIEQQKIKLATDKQNLKDQVNTLLFTSKSIADKQQVLSSHVQVNFQTSNEKYEFNNKSNNLQQFINLHKEHYKKKNLILTQPKKPIEEKQVQQEKKKKVSKIMTDEMKEFQEKQQELQKCIKKQLTYELNEIEPWTTIGKEDKLTKWQLNKKDKTDSEQPEREEEQYKPSIQIKQLLPDFTVFDEYEKQIFEDMKNEQIQRIQRNLTYEDIKEIEEYCMKLIQQEKEKIYLEKINSKALRNMEETMGQRVKKLFTTKQPHSSENNLSLQEELKSPQLQLRLQNHQANQSILDNQHSFVKSQIEMFHDENKETEKLQQKSKRAEEMIQKYTDVKNARKKLDQLNNEKNDLEKRHKLEAEKAIQDKTKISQMIVNAKRQSREGVNMSYHTANSYVGKSFLSNQLEISRLESENAKKITQLNTLDLSESKSEYYSPIQSQNVSQDECQKDKLMEDKLNNKEKQQYECKQNLQKNINKAQYKQEEEQQSITMQQRQEEQRDNNQSNVTFETKLSQQVEMQQVQEEHPNNQSANTLTQPLNQETENYQQTSQNLKTQAKRDQELKQSGQHDQSSASASNLPTTNNSIKQNAQLLDINETVNDVENHENASNVNKDEIGFAPVNDNRSYLHDFNISVPSTLVIPQDEVNQKELQKMLNECIYCKLQKIYKNQNDVNYRVLEGSHKMFVQLYKICQKLQLKTAEDVYRNYDILSYSKLISNKQPAKLLIHYIISHSDYFNVQDPNKLVNEVINNVKSSQLQLKCEIEEAIKPQINILSDKYRQQMNDLTHTSFYNMKTVVENHPLQCTNLKTEISQFVSSPYQKTVQDEKKKITKMLRSKGKY